MMAATLIGLWLWQTNAIRQVWNIPMLWLIGALLVAFALLRSTGALALLMIGVAMLVVAKQLRTALPVFLLIAAMGIYLYINAGTETYFSDQLVEFLEQIFPEDRVASLEFRLNNEEILVDHAREKLAFGWSGWNQARVVIPETGKLAIQDSLWVLALGENGLVGLISLFSAMLLPVVALFWSRCPARLWTNPQISPTVGVAVALVLYMLDCILNAMINPIYILACGGIAGLVMSPERKRQSVSKSASPRRYVTQQR